jgi:hypothetical protein
MIDSDRRPFSNRRPLLKSADRVNGPIDMKVGKDVDLRIS